MCIAVFDWQPDAERAFLLAGNRDEFYARPTESMHWWPGGHILAGHDLRADGAWLGITRGGRFALITNIRDPSLRRSGAPSRGRIVRDFLESTVPAASYVQKLAANASSYEGFNLLCGSVAAGARELWFLNSTHAGPQRLDPGLYGVSNASLDTDWPKLRRAKQGFRHALAERAPAAQDERLLRLLRNATPTAERELPATGVPVSWERVLGSIFINHDGYGTRASTVVRVTGGAVSVHEINYGADAAPEPALGFGFSLA